MPAWAHSNQSAETGSVNFLAANLQRGNARSDKEINPLIELWLERGSQNVERIVLRAEDAFLLREGLGKVLQGPRWKKARQAVAMLHEKPPLVKKRVRRVRRNRENMSLRAYGEHSIPSGQPPIPAPTQRYFREFDRWIVLERLRLLNNTERRLGLSVHKRMQDAMRCLRAQRIPEGVLEKTLKAVILQVAQLLMRSRRRHIAAVRTVAGGRAVTRFLEALRHG